MYRWRCARARSWGSRAWWARGARNCAAPSSAWTRSTPAASSSPAGSAHPLAARGRRAGIALVTEDRQRTGLCLRLPLSAQPHARQRAGHQRRWGLLDLAAEQRATREYTERLRIRAASPNQLAGRLSGGNQQKIVIAKWLFRKARVFLFDEPTRGIDVGAKAEVFEIMDELARSGAAVLMVSSEMPELLQVADRILVMRQGRISGELPRRTTQEEIMRLAALDQQESATS